MSEQDKDKEEAPEAAENTETETPTESSPALPPTKDADKPADQISATIGEVGRWQLQKILIVFLASAPGQYLTEVKILQSERRPLLGFFLG